MLSKNYGRVRVLLKVHSVKLTAEYKRVKYSCKDKFTYSHCGHKCLDNIELSVISLNCSFSEKE